MLKVKRVYEKPDRVDGTRILVDRLWPRGLSKEDAKIDAWIRELAPSDSLRKWFGHKEERWDEFKKRYREELKGKEILTGKLSDLAKKQAVTLLFAAKDEIRNNAAALLGFLQKK